MPKRPRPGRPYRLNFPEFYVDCAAPDCEESTLLSESGGPVTLRAAEARARQYGPDSGADWHRVAGLWYCPAHH